ncbi:2-amino-4-hydroxy-6-hydroxymethyldihydropteridinediphosphokinase [Saccharicrinis carchari]|uniref:2-amino-4-hydroxy-6-hydroxymethyldihydropteridine pyrophosphokinase n=1 Tax=Saccharicrinis carchari TaxID=1168039 RepID=A0A521BWM1_SACCC|nr:2-amino-4-hydroxy-6-hydroxymethyldihydropteridine diphosphokinase [Saccharicrinis carchari]SMO51579.1 2-amino-4-hydroxy-6-hydroxymethyldihydropteridinediphosphokinase [Saccharicrinis carchari]
MNKAIIGLGSNIDAPANLNRAVELLKEQFSVVKVSQWMQTQPIGITEQPVFFNGVLVMETTLELKPLETALKNLEDRMGRDRTRPKFGPREIDLDVILWNGQVVDDDYYTRDFLQSLVREVL